MLAAPNMILVGAARREAGKTEFACAVIRALSERGVSVVGAKVTVVRPGERGFHGDVPRREELLAGRLSHVLVEER
ncbi:MAG: hypothetical protein PHF00_05680, partial [Elusimicrobia bacterium]|nr:hypothetical protein [Elusimicrobiota bacterium]